jgi:hypothetical protein
MQIWGGYFFHMVVFLNIREQIQWLLLFEVIIRIYQTKG